MSFSQAYYDIIRVLCKKYSMPFVTIEVNPGRLEESRPSRFCIGGSPTEPHTSLHHVSGMKFHMNPAPFLYLPPSSSLPITNHHIQPAPLSIIPWPSTQN